MHLLHQGAHPLPPPTADGSAEVIDWARGPEPLDPVTATSAAPDMAAVGSWVYPTGAQERDYQASLLSLVRPAGPSAYFLAFSGLLNFPARNNKKPPPFLFFPSSPSSSPFPSRSFSSRGQGGHHPLLHLRQHASVPADRPRLDDGGRRRHVQLLPLVPGRQGEPSLPVGAAR